MQRQQAERELAEGTWQDYREPGQVLVELHCLFDGRSLLASAPVWAGPESDVQELRADLLECEGMTEAEATWVVVRP